MASTGNKKKSPSKAAPQGLTVTAVLQQNWYLILLFVGIVGVTLYQFRGTNEDPTQTANTSSVSTPKTPRPQPAPIAPEAKRPVDRTPVDKATMEIKDLQAQIQREVDSEDISERLYQIGSLYYSDLKDFKLAAEVFTDIIDEHPESIYIIRSFDNLIMCYTKLENPEMLRITYIEMQNHFPKGSFHHENATEALAGM
jgi:hypothetical protein